MATSNDVKIDSAFKFIHNKGYTSTNKGLDNEDAPSGFLLGTSSIFAQDAGIPTTAPGTTTSLLTFYGDGTAGHPRFRMIYDVSSPLNQAWYASTDGTNITTMRNTRVPNWISPAFGNYTIRIFLTHGSSTTAAFVPGGEILFSDATSPLFDYKTGILTFSSDPIAAYSGLSPTPDGIQISGYVYAGELLSQLFDAYGNFTKGLSVLGDTTGVAIMEAGTGLTVTAPSGGSGNSNGVTTIGYGDGYGLLAIGGASNAAGIVTDGSGSGAGIIATGGSSNGTGGTFIGVGSGAGIIAAGGATAGFGIQAIGGVGAPGVVATAGSGGSAPPGIVGTGGLAGGPGVLARGGSSAGGIGLIAQGDTTGAGIDATGGATGNSIVSHSAITNDAGQVITQDNDGNIRYVIDHIGYPSGRRSEYRENWAFPISNTDTSTTGTNQRVFPGYSPWSYRKAVGASVFIANASNGLGLGAEWNRMICEASSVSTGLAAVLYSSMPWFQPEDYTSAVLEFDMAFETLTGANIAVGFVDFANAGSTSSPVNAQPWVGIGARGTDATLQAIIGNGTTLAYTSTGVAVADDTWFTVRIEWHNASSPYGTKVRYFVNGVIAVEVTSNVPGFATVTAGAAFELGSWITAGSASPIVQIGPVYCTFNRGGLSLPQV